MTLVQATFVLATFVHMRNISVLLSLFWSNFLDSIFWMPYFFNQNFFNLKCCLEPNFRGRILVQSWTDSNCTNDICPGDICPYEKYLNVTVPILTKFFRVPHFFLRKNLFRPKTLFGANFFFNQKFLDHNFSNPIFIFDLKNIWPKIFWA